MPIICKNNIFILFVSALMQITDDEKLKNYMRRLHGWSDKDYYEYKKIFLEKYNNFPDDVELLAKEGKI